jgi:hypothetical protein
MKSVKDQVRNHPETQVWIQVLNEVQIEQVWDQVLNQVWNQVRDQVCLLVIHEIS